MSLNIPINIVQAMSRIIVLVLMVLVISSCSEPDTIPELFLDEPAWLAKTKAPTVSTAEEVRALWQSEKRCCDDRKDKLIENAKIFYKACYMGIANNRRDEKLVALCLNLMMHKMPRDVVRTIQEHYLENYFYHRAPIDHCVNCLPGDQLAGVSEKYAYSISREGDYRGAKAMINRVLDERGDEISPYVQMRLYSGLARVYEKSSFTESEFSALEEAYASLKPPVGSKGAKLSNYKYLAKAIERLSKIEPTMANVDF